MAQDLDTPTPPELRLEPGERIAAVVSSYHRELTGAMAASARAELVRAGLSEEGLIELDVPGAFELPLIARRLAVREDVRAVMCFGLILKGETVHDRVIADAVAVALQQAAFMADTPILFGVLTCDTLDQARARALSTEAGGTHDKGREVARAAVAAVRALEAAAKVGTAPSSTGFAGRFGASER